MRKAADASGVQGGHHALPDLLRRQAEVQRPEGDVVEDGGVEQLVVAVLEDDADVGRQLPALFPNRPAGGTANAVVSNQWLMARSEGGSTATIQGCH